jgi:hypothetical protein
MNDHSTYHVAASLSPAGASELKRLNHGLRINEPLGHDRAAIAHLIELKLACANGMAVRITELGYEVLQLVP